MSKEKQQGDSLFGMLTQVNEHNETYGTTYNLVEIDKKEFNKFR